MNNGITVENLSKSFGKETVLNHISFNVPHGSIVGIVGNNGSGKTVLMKCICGFLRPDSGKVIVDGAIIGKDCDFPKNIGIIIESPGFIQNLSGYKNLKILASLKGIAEKKDIQYALKLVGLNSDMKKSVSKYSLGMKQRLGIAQAIMENPDILILDEPFNALDKNTVTEMRDLLESFKNEGKAILLVSHNSEDIRILCDNIIELEVIKNEKAN